MDWEKFQTEYRDYIDLAKMRLVPIIGAPVGAYANYQLLQRLGSDDELLSYAIAE